MEEVSPSSHQDMLGCLALISRSGRRKRGRGQTAAVVISTSPQHWKKIGGHNIIEVVK